MAPKKAAAPPEAALRYEGTGPKPGTTLHKASMLLHQLRGMLQSESHLRSLLPWGEKFS